MMLNRRRTDDGNVRITRSIAVSAGWLFSILLGIAGWGISNYYVFMKWAEATEKNVGEMKRLSDNMNAKDVKDEGILTKIAEHERRIGVLERRNDK